MLLCLETLALSTYIMNLQLRIYLSLCLETLASSTCFLTIRIYMTMYNTHKNMHGDKKKKPQENNMGQFLLSTY